MQKGRRRTSTRISKYLIAIAVAVIGSVVLPSWSPLPRHLAAVALAIIVIAAIEVLERQIRTASNATFKELAETIDEVFWMRSPETGAIAYISPAYERVTGYRRTDLYAQPDSWARIVHPDDAERVCAYLNDPQRGGSLQFRIVRKDGGIRILETTMFPIRDERGVIRNVAGSARDITEQHQLAEQVRQTQKLESLGLLAGGIAHDFNNVLSVIGANSSMLGETITDAADRELVVDIEEAVRRATALTRQLLAFSRKQATNPVVLDVNAAISDTHKMLHRMVGEDIAIETSLDPELEPVLIDPGHLVQIVMNLAVNARDAMSRGGRLKLTTRQLAGHEVQLSVTDSGCGMTRDVMAHVFEPFFTTKGPTKGTGLGLSVVHGIVEQAGGRIELRSEVGVGTTFEIYLPSAQAVVAACEAALVEPTRGAETIMFVDDDIYVRTTAARALRSKGYTVLEADDGDSALAVLRACGHQVALLVTDIVMPGMDGAELAAEARRSYPSLRVLYSTGYTEDAVIKHGIDRDQVAVIEKPFGPHVLATRVREMLDRP
jgi:PAS domain S-box-containing protein